MKYNKKSKLKLATAVLLMGGLFNAQAFSLSDYFPKNDANDDMAQEAPVENAATTQQAKPAETYKMGRAEQYDQWILQRAESTTSGNEKCNLIHQLVNDNVVSTATFIGGGSSFTTTGADADKVSLQLGFGYDSVVSDDSTVSLDLNADLRADYDSMSGSLTYKSKF